MYYFDYASTTKPSTQVIDLYTKLLNDVFEHPDGNNKAGKLMLEAQKMITSSLQLNSPYEVIFTSGGTEANNLAIIGYAKNFTSSKHFITSKYEHSSADSCFKHLEALGHSVTYLNVTTDGQVDYDQLRQAITDNTVMISIMAVNNEIGTINCPQTIKQIIKDSGRDIVYMSDAVQAVGKVNYDYNHLDIITVSGHKLYAPKAIGAVIYRKPLKLVNTIYGGAQQEGIRPGTMCPCLSAVLAYAIKNEMVNLQATIEHTQLLTEQFVTYIENHPKAKLNVVPMASTVSVSFKTKAQSESLITVLNNMDIYASTRSACSKKLNVPSRTLSSIGLSIHEIDRSVRFSFSRNTDVAEINYLCSKLDHILEIY
ncbi:aminotransferase class V-fold PLP-dependent enzyme [Mollicutes bacterium LVI A0039]|nr:aminotransferase class V-fold PLP-dependent enzyme [Mollicutes bacterium LVI A0039]